jgi:hypothetical protein
MNTSLVVPIMTVIIGTLQPLGMIGMMIQRSRLQSQPMLNQPPKTWTLKFTMTDLRPRTHLHLLLMTQLISIQQWMILGLLRGRFPLGLQIARAASSINENRQYGYPP